jgi:hypothetical protein
MTFLFYVQPFLLDGYFITQNERSIRFMKKTLKRLCTGFLALATVVTALPITPVHAESKQYWTESKERVATDKNGNKEIEAGKEVTIIDTVQR